MAIRIALGTTQIVEKHTPESVGVDRENPDAGLTALDARTPEGAGSAELIGNVSPEGQAGPDQLVKVTRPDLGNQITYVDIPDVDYLPAKSGPGNMEHVWRPLRASEIVAIVNAKWNYHSDSDGPEWVECENEAVARAIADEFTWGDHECVVGRPDGWEETQLGDGEQPIEVPHSSPQPQGLGDLAAAEAQTWDERSKAIKESGEPTALMVNGGRDMAFRLLYDTVRTGLSGGFSYMALTENTTAPAASSTTLTGEIATAGGGLLRAQAAYAHTNGTATATLTKTFTANGSDVLPKVLAKIGLFDAATVGLMGHETLLNSTATLNVSGDNVTVTDTITVTPS